MRLRSRSGEPPTCCGPTRPTPVESTSCRHLDLPPFRLQPVPQRQGSIEADLLNRSGKTRALTTEDFSQKTAIFLKREAQLDCLVSLPDSEDRATKIIEAMESIEKDYTSLHGVLPKSEQFADVLLNVMRQVKILREQKEELLQARDLLLPRLLSWEVAA